MIKKTLCIKNHQFLRNDIGYGYLYNGYAALNPLIAPIGWHVPSETEWQTLIDFCGGGSVAGGILKQTGTTKWVYPNTGAVDYYGFSILPSGSYSSEFYDINYYANFLTSTNTSGFTGYQSVLSVNFLYNSSGVSQNVWNSIENGYAIRLIKDNSVNEDTVIDIDNNTYETVTIGTQVWTAQNLAVSKYRDGSLIGSDMNSEGGGKIAYNNNLNNVFNLYGSITGITDNNEIRYYQSGITSDGYIARIPILLKQTIDDIGFYTPIDTEWVEYTTYFLGETIVYDNKSYVCESGHTSGEYFDENYWSLTEMDTNSGYTVTYTGETQINQFRRYTKKDTDADLYNPESNSGFTQQITTSSGMVMQLVREKTKENGLDYRNLYDYKFWLSGDTGTTINYSDINSSYSVISYNSNGLNSKNAINVPNVKLDYLIGVVNAPKINIDVFIDRGSNSSFDRHIKLGEIKSLDDLEGYNNGYYIIKED